MCQGKGGLRSNPILPQREGPFRKTPFGGPGAIWSHGAEAPLFSPTRTCCFLPPSIPDFIFVKGTVFVVSLGIFHRAGPRSVELLYGPYVLGAVHGACGVLHAEKGDSQAVLQKVLKLSKNTSRRA